MHKRSPHKKLPTILDSRWRDPSDMFRIQELDLEEEAAREKA